MDIAVAYLRVSTDRQGKSGLGLEAQEGFVCRYAEITQITIVKTYVEIDSGGNNDRGKIADAIAYCKKHGTLLLISTLDRLARDVFFIVTLIKSGIRFITVDSPDDSECITVIKAALAQEERKKNSERTKAALAAAKARGVRLGTTSKQLSIRNKQRANEFAVKLYPIIEGLQQCGIVTVRDTVKELNRRKVPTFRKKGKWHVSSTYALLIRIQEYKNKIPSNENNDCSGFSYPLQQLEHTGTG